MAYRGRYQGPPAKRPSDVSSKPTVPSNMKEEELNKKTSQLTDETQTQISTVPGSIRKVHNRRGRLAGKQRTPAMSSCHVLPICYACLEWIREEDFVMSTEQIFHKDCFVCQICKQPVRPGDHTFFDRYIYHKKDCVSVDEKENAPEEAGEHYNNRVESATHKGHRISERCHKCKLPVRGTDYTISLNLVWHRVCHKCALCGRQLTPGDHAMFRLLGDNTEYGPYCTYPCYNRKFVKPFTGQ